MKARLLLITLTMCIMSCQDDEDAVLSEAFVDVDLQAYFEAFVSEGLSRSVDVNFNEIEIEGYIDRTESNSIVGQCFFNSESPNRVVINQRYWLRATDLEREMIVFHELGHCYLQRSHLDVSDASGDCISLMHSSDTVCNLDYTTLSRSDYLDELFAQ